MAYSPICEPGVKNLEKIVMPLIKYKIKGSQDERGSLPLYIPVCILQLFKQHLCLQYSEYCRAAQAKGLSTRHLMCFSPTQDGACQQHPGCNGYRPESAGIMHTMPLPEASLCPRTQTEFSKNSTPFVPIQPSKLSPGLSWRRLQLFPGFPDGGKVWVLIGRA